MDQDSEENSDDQTVPHNDSDSDESEESIAENGDGFTALNRYSVIGIVNERNNSIAADFTNLHQHTDENGATESGASEQNLHASEGNIDGVEIREFGHPQMISPPPVLAEVIVVEDGLEEGRSNGKSREHHYQEKDNNCSSTVEASLPISSSAVNPKTLSVPSDGQIQNKKKAWSLVEPPEVPVSPSDKKKPSLPCGEQGETKSLRELKTVMRRRPETSKTVKNLVELFNRKGSEETRVVMENNEQNQSRSNRNSASLLSPEPFSPSGKKPILDLVERFQGKQTENQTVGAAIKGSSESTTKDVKRLDKTMLEKWNKRNDEDAQT